MTKFKICRFHLASPWQKKYYKIKITIGGEKIIRWKNKEGKGGKKFHILQTQDRRDPISPGNKGEEHQTDLHMHPAKLSDEDMFTKQMHRGEKSNTEKI